MPWIQKINSAAGCHGFDRLTTLGLGRKRPKWQRLLPGGMVQPRSLKFTSRKVLEDGSTWSHGEWTLILRGPRQLTTQSWLLCLGRGDHMWVRFPPLLYCFWVVLSSIITTMITWGDGRGGCVVRLIHFVIALLTVIVAISIIIELHTTTWH